MKVTFEGTEKEINTLLTSMNLKGFDQCVDSIIKKLNQQANRPAIEYKQPIVDVVKQGGGIKEVRIDGVTLPVKRFTGLQYSSEIGIDGYDVLISFKAQKVAEYQD